MLIANEKRFNMKDEIQAAEEKDCDWEQVSKMPEQAHDLIIITKVKNWEFILLR